MKKIAYLIFCLVLSNISYSDIIPENSHYIDKCVKIINANDFEEYCFIALIKSPTGDNENTYIIKPNNCLEVGYKFNNLHLFAIKKSLLAKQNLKTIDWFKDSTILKANISIDCHGGYLNNFNPTFSVDEFYKIVEFTNTKFVLYKCKEVIKSKEGRPISIKTYSYLPGGKIININNTEENGKMLAENDSYSVVFSFLKALLITIIIETLVLFLFFKTLLKKIEISKLKLLFTGIFTSVATLPYLWFVLPLFITNSLYYIVFGELSVVIIESLILLVILNIKFKTAILVSFICNLFSFVIGLLINN